MSIAPFHSPFEAVTNASFEALMWGLSRPGLPRDLPSDGFSPILEALIDRECHVHCDTPEAAGHAQNLGAQEASLAMADHVFLQTVLDAEFLGDLACGSDLYPEGGATLVVPAVFGSGQRLRLTGPGVDGDVTLLVGGLPADFWRKRRAAMRYPQGFEIFLVDGAQVIGIPRSTLVEEL